MPNFAFAQLICPKHGGVEISEDQYRSGLNNKPNERWKCPICGSDSAFDDKAWDELHPFDDDERA